MKKFLTLVTLLLCVAAGMNATTYKITYNGSDAGDTDYFSKSGNHNFNTKFNGCTYDEVTFTSGLKMEGSTVVSWTSTAEATVTIVQSTWQSKGETKTIKLDGTVLDQSEASTATSGAFVYTITNVAAGTHSVTRGSGESGVFAIYVEYTGSVKTQLSTPVLTVNTTTGQVSIADVANATKITYTTDGSTPTASSDTYSAPFVVADGVTVKAIAIGDNISYINSDVASETVILTGITIADPVVKQSYGTVALSCASPNATIEYSLDGGSNWIAYSRAFTLTTNTDLKARASRTGCTASAVIDATITAVPANAKTSTLVMGYGAFTASGKVMTGKVGDVAEGYTLTMLTEQDKSWSSRNSITISSISATRTTICGSNGVQCRLDLPTGVKATKLTLYSYVNSATTSTNSAWKEVNGENLNSVINDVPMGAFTDLGDYQSNPDIRIFPLDNVEGSITFTNGGTQTCFVIELDVIEPDIDMTITSAGWASFSSIKEVAIPAGVTAYYASSSDGSKVTLTEIAGGYIPANTGVIVAGAEGSYGAAITSTSATLGGTNLLKPWYAAGIPSDAEYYTLAVDASKPVFKKSTGGTLAAGKAYLVVPSSARESLDINFGEETTGINAIKENANNRYFNLQGVEVAQPTKGLYIVNGKKVLVK